MTKLAWSGTLLGVQPRIDLMRSFDIRQHTYLGYLLLIEGTIADESRRFTVRVGPGAMVKHRFHAGMKISGAAELAADPEREVAELYKVAGLKVIAAADVEPAPPPWHGVPPTLPVYRERGHRRLDARTYEAQCLTCKWACCMAVTMIIDQWNPQKRRYRFETFCYGPKSCKLYRAGPTRKVPGRNGMTWEEEDWVDEEATAGRGQDA
ncbi:MAG: hypothetical protein K2Y35_00715 [Burkholderiales bacterium]|nr:hypothetical protein [Burkholderiales bacterium]